MSLAVFDRDVTLYLAAEDKRHLAAWIEYTAGCAGPDGDFMQSAEKAAEALHVTTRTITNWHREAAEIGLVAWTDGGYRGRCMEGTLSRWVVDKIADYGKKAKAVVYAYRRRLLEAKKEATRRRKEGLARLRKAETNFGPLTSLEGEDRTGESLALSVESVLGSISRRSVSQTPRTIPNHAFVPDTAGASCLQCQLPPTNGRHMRA